MSPLRRAETRSDWALLLGSAAERGGARELLSVSRNPYFARAYALLALGGEGGTGRAVIHRDDRWARAHGRAVGWITILDGPATPGLVGQVVAWAREQGLEELRTYRGSAIVESLGWTGAASEDAWTAVGFSSEGGHADWSVLLTDAPFLESVAAELERQRSRGRWESLPIHGTQDELAALAEGALSPSELRHLLSSTRRLVFEPVSRVFRAGGETVGAWLALDPTASRWGWGRRRERLFVLTFPFRAKSSGQRLESAALAETLHRASEEGWREVVFLAVSEDEPSRSLRAELESLGCAKGKVLPIRRLGVRSGA